MSAIIEGMRNAAKSAYGLILSRTRTGIFQEDAEIDLVRMVENEFTRRQTERRPWDLQWRLNIAFLDGKQYLEINNRTDDLREVPKLYWWQEREVFNQIAPNVETRLAKLGRMRPKLGARPGPDYEDLAKARVTQGLLDYQQQERFTHQFSSSLLPWVETCGVCFVFSTWDPNAGRIVGEAVIRATDETPSVRDDTTKYAAADAEGIMRQALEFDAQLLPLIVGEPEVQISPAGTAMQGQARVPVREGDTRAVIVPATEIYPDSPWHNGWEGLRNLIWAHAVPVDEVYRTWGVKVNAERTALWEMHKDVQSYGGLGYGIGGYHISAKEAKDYCIVKQWFETPSLRYPRGRYFVVAGGKVVFGPTPLMWNVGARGEPGLPFSRFPCIERPGCFWPRTIIERLIPIQRRYNALRNRKAEYMTRFAIGQLAVERGSLNQDEDAEQDLNAPGAIIEYKRGTLNPPKYMEFHTWPQAFETEESTLLNEFAIISGVSEAATRSQAPPGVKSGVALSVILEQDDTRLSLTAANLEAGWLDLAKQQLRLLKQNAVGPRIVQTTGYNRKGDVIEFEASDIMADDVIVVASALLADSPAQRRALIFDMIEAGLFYEPGTGTFTKAGLHKVFEMLQFLDWERGDELDDLHIQRAERENRLLAQGQLQEAKLYDDDGLHVVTHLKYMLQGKFEDEDAAAQGQLGAIFQQHIQLHVQSEMVKNAAIAAPSPRTVPTEPRR